MSYNYFEILKLLYKAMIYASYTPLKWKEGKVIFMHKPGKLSYKIAKDFRPIPLTNHFLKEMENLVVQKVDTILEDNPLSEHQQGFKRCRSTETAI